MNRDNALIHIATVVALAALALQVGAWLLLPDDYLQLTLLPAPEPVPLDRSLMWVFALHAVATLGLCAWATTRSRRDDWEGVMNATQFALLATMLTAGVFATDWIFEAQAAHPYVLGAPSFFAVFLLSAAQPVAAWRARIADLGL